MGFDEEATIVFTSIYNMSRILHDELRGAPLRLSRGVSPTDSPQVKLPTDAATRLISDLIKKASAAFALGDRFGPFPAEWNFCEILKHQNSILH